jgi:hypothetical protein
MTAPMNDTNSSSTRTSLSFGVEYCHCCNRFFYVDYNNLLMTLLMTAKMAAMEVDDDGCDVNVVVVCMLFVGRDVDGDNHCREGMRANQKYLDRLIP